jgi:hypothetical protein
VATSGPLTTGGIDVVIIIAELLFVKVVDVVAVAVVVTVRGGSEEDVDDRKVVGPRQCGLGRC